MHFNQQKDIILDENKLKDHFNKRPPIFVCSPRRIWIQTEGFLRWVFHSGKGVSKIKISSKYPVFEFEFWFSELRCGGVCSGKLPTLCHRTPLLLVGFTVNLTILLDALTLSFWCFYTHHKSPLHHMLLYDTCYSTDLVIDTVGLPHHYGNLHVTQTLDNGLQRRYKLNDKM